jgi:uncharacterized protein YdbL (DUF1318 family)
MEQESAPGEKKQLTAIAKAARTKRIFARLNEGWAYDEVARDERLSGRRVRQIVSQVLDRREVDGEGAHAHLQLGRLGPALRVALQAVAEGDVKAIAPLIKVLDRLDRYQKTAGATRAPRRKRPTAAGDELVMREVYRRIRRDTLAEIEAERTAQQTGTSQS